jgi:hypothetical protein
LRIYFDLGKAVTVGRKEKKQHYSTIEFHTLETLLYIQQRERGRLGGEKGAKGRNSSTAAAAIKHELGGKKSIV